VVRARGDWPDVYPGSERNSYHRATPSMKERRHIVRRISSRKITVFKVFGPQSWVRVEMELRYRYAIQSSMNWNSCFRQVSYTITGIQYNLWSSARLFEGCRKLEFIFMILSIKQSHSNRPCWCISTRSTAHRSPCFGA